MSEDIRPTGPTPKEIEDRAESALKAGIDTIISRERDRWLGQAADVIKRHGEVDPSDRPEFLNSGGESIVRTASPTLPIYRTLSPAEQKIRNPDFDHWGREWLQGLYRNDGAQRMLAHAKIDEMYPEYARADTLEGSASATGGFADGSGAEFLPRPLEEAIAIARDLTAKMPSFATTYQLTTQEHNVPTGGAMTGYMQAEGTSPTTTGFAVAQVPLIARKSVAKAVVSSELLEDSAVNVVNFITRRGGAALGVVQDEQWFKEGDGSAPNVTMITGAAYAEATTNALAYADVIGIYNTLTQPYHPNARWFIASDVLGFMAGVVDGNGRPFYQSLFDAPMAIDDTETGGPNSRAQGTLVGHPVHKTVLTAGSIWFGDPAACYAIGRRGGIRVESSRDFYFDTFRTVFLISERIAGNNLDSANAAQLATGILSATT